MRKPKVRPFSSIRWRIMLLYFLITLAAFIVVHFSVSFIVETYLVDVRVAEERASAQIIAAEVARPLSENDANMLQTLTLERGRSMGGRILVLDASGVVQSDRDSRLNGTRLLYPEVERVLFGGERSAYGFHHIGMTTSTGEADFLEGLALALQPSRQWVIYTVCPVTLGGSALGAVLLSTSIDNVVTSLSDLSLRSATVFATATACVLLLTFLMSSFITRPLQTLTAAVRKMGRGQFHQRVRVSGGSEIKELGEAFNLMSEMLERTDQLRNDFVSSASHELKTPLSTIKILIETVLYQSKFDEAMTKEFLTDVNSEIDRLSQTISDLLRLVSIDREEGALKSSIVQADALIMDVCKRIAPLAERKGVELKADSPPIALLADPLKIQQAVFNLVDNAIKYTEAGGSVHVFANISEDMVLISVKDTGFGIPKEDIPRLFERFYRVDKARSRGTGGTGLGLAIVERIAKMHGGWVDVDSTEGLGSTFTLVLPTRGVDGEA